MINGRNDRSLSRASILGDEHADAGNALFQRRSTHRDGQTEQATGMRRCARDAAVAHRFDIRVKPSGVTGSGGTGFPGAPFFISEGGD